MYEQIPYLFKQGQQCHNCPPPPHPLLYNNFNFCIHCCWSVLLWHLLSFHPVWAKQKRSDWEKTLICFFLFSLSFFKWLSSVGMQTVGLFNCVDHKAYWKHPLQFTCIANLFVQQGEPGCQSHTTAASASQNIWGEKPTEWPLCLVHKLKHTEDWQISNKTFKISNNTPVHWWWETAAAIEWGVLYSLECKNETQIIVLFFLAVNTWMSDEKLVGLQPREGRLIVQAQ